MFFRPFKLHRKTKHTVGSITLTEPLKGALEFMYPSLCVHCRVPWSSCIPHCVYIAGCLGVHVSLTVCTLQGALEFMCPHCVYIARCLGVHVSLTVCTLQGALEFMYPSLCVHCRVPWSSCIPHCVYIAGCLGVHVSLTVCTLQGALEFMYPSLCVHCRVPWSSCIQMIGFT